MVDDAPTSSFETATPAPPDPGLVKLVEALARAQARRDHRADLAARQQPKGCDGSGPGVRVKDPNG